MPFRPSTLKPLNQPVIKRLSHSKRGYDRAHEKWRRAILMRDPVCVIEGCGQRSTDADHIVRIQEGGARFDMSNGQGMCHKHHSIKTWGETHGSTKP